MGDTMMIDLPINVISNHKSIDYLPKYSVRIESVPYSKDIIKTVAMLRTLFEKRGVHSVNALKAAGFTYTNNEDTARCDDCGLEVSQWTIDMDPFTIHSTRKPNCSFVLSMKSPKPLPSSSYSTFSTPLLSSFSSPSSPSTAVVRSGSTSNDLENPSKRQKTEANHKNNLLNSLFEIDKIQQIRRRTFSHWPHRTTPSKSQMIEAGFFNCNVGDRVICIYCNLICQQWTPHTDDPCEVHKTLSPNCIYVKSKLIRREPGSILIVNETAVAATSGSHSVASNNLEQFRCNEFVHMAACNAAYSELPKRTASFTAAWPGDNLPPVDDLVKAGFFYTGTKNIVTCFYCNGSLQNWGPNDNPTIEHARWFPHCAYAKQLCGDELYRKIQESKRAQQERARTTESKEKVGSTGIFGGNTTAGSKQLLIPDESTLSRLVAARLDLDVSQYLLNQDFKLSIIKRCWEDQLRLKQDDFESNCDIHMACLILQKQIKSIDGKKENIVIPSIKMKKLREDAEKERAEALAREQTATAPIVPVLTQLTSTTFNSTDVEMRTSLQSATTESTLQAIKTENQEETKVTKPSTSSASELNQINDSSPVNPCVLCLTEEKRLACIPCGHLATCVPCGHSLRSCPICRREIEAFVRIYV